MSRSVKHTPVTGFCLSTSEKFYKRLRASRERRIVRDRLRRGEIDGLHVTQVPWNEWHTSRDGKVWWGWERMPEKCRRK